MRKLRRCAAVFTGFAGVLAAQTVVVTGTGDANVDVPAVQAAVDKGGRVVLMGHFSFDRAPATPSGEMYARMVTISKEVTLSGAVDANGEMTTIEGGFVPFFAKSPGLTNLHRTIAFWRLCSSG